VNGEAAQEVHRVPEHPVPARDLPVDTPAADGRVARRSRRDVADEDDAAVSHEQQELATLVDLDVIPAGIPRPRRGRSLQHAPEPRRHAAGPRKPLHLLKRKDGLRGVMPVEPVDGAERVAEAREPALELDDARAAGSRPESRKVDRDGDPRGCTRPAGGGDGSDPQAITALTARGDAQRQRAGPGTPQPPCLDSK
jgi:hypothetical protein